MCSASCIYHFTFFLPQHSRIDALRIRQYMQSHSHGTISCRPISFYGTFGMVSIECTVEYWNKCQPYLKTIQTVCKYTHQYHVVHFRSLCLTVDGLVCLPMTCHTQFYSFVQSVIFFLFIVCNLGGFSLFSLLINSKYSNSFEQIFNVEIPSLFKHQTNALRFSFISILKTIIKYGLINFCVVAIEIVVDKFILNLSIDLCFITFGLHLVYIVYKSQI